MANADPVERIDAELAQARTNSAAFAAISGNVIRCTGAIVDLKTHEVGSGTFVEIDGRLFVATASHLVPADPHGRLGFVTFAERKIEETAFSILGFARRSGDWPDVAYLELSPGVVSELGKTPITLDRISPRGVGLPDVIAGLVGYPSEFVRQQRGLIVAGKQEIDLNFSMVYYPGLPLPPKSWPAPSSPLPSKTTDLFLPYDLETELYRPPGDGFPDRLAIPKGTSGGGWWQSVHAEGKVWHPERVQLIGI